MRLLFRFACLLLLALPARALGLAELRGSWQLDRTQSDSMRTMLAAQGYNAFEIGILERIPVRQVIEPGAGGTGLTIHTRTTVVGTSEILTLDDVFRPAESPLGPIQRAAAWEESARTLRTRIRYQARNGQAAEMWVARRWQDESTFVQETRLRLADGREFRAKQLFRRK